MMRPANICGLAVARLRQKRGLTQEDLRQRCKSCGWQVARSVLAKVEMQRRSVSDFELVALAKALRVKVNALLKDHAKH